jgi:hypothetical protein
MNKLTLLTLLGVLVNKKVLSSKEAEGLACVEQVTATLISKGICDDEEFNIVLNRYRDVISRCRSILASGYPETRKKDKRKLLQLLGKECSIACEKRVEPVI